MSHELPDSASRIPSDAASKQESSAASNLETDRMEGLSRQAGTPATSIPSTAKCEKKLRKRQDHGRLHATRHAVLSRFPLETLGRLGENVKKVQH